MDFVIKNQVLCEYIWNYVGTNTNKVNIILDNLKNEYNFNVDQLKHIKMSLHNNFFRLYSKKWKAAFYKKNVFQKKYATFLNENFVVKFDIDFNRSVHNISASSSNVSLENPLAEEQNKIIKLKKGRPRLSYEESSEKTKKRRVQELISKYGAEELIKAADCLRNQCNDDFDINESTDDIEININDVLAMYVDLELTKAKYEKLRTYNKKLYGKPLYPPYNSIKNAKEKCYPKALNVSDLSASIDVKSLLHHTTERILLTLDKNELHDLRDKKLILYGKWGMDGASGQQTTRQKWSVKTDVSKKSHHLTYADDNNDERAMFRDNAVFVICFVPIQLVTDNNYIIWKNERPSSVYYCRPIKFEFIKESNSNTAREYKFYSDIFNQSDPSFITLENLTFNVSFNIQCTMIDGKTCNILSDQKSSNCCNICGVGPKMINDLQYVKNLPSNDDNYKYGLSTLHCWIRFMEYLLHISYNLDFKKNSAKGEDKILKAERKKMIQKNLKSKLSLVVDVVKQGAGTTNTGNVARCFFAKAEAVAEITGLNKNLIGRLGIILQVLACGKDIDCNKFEKYCLDTAELCVNLYPWYNIPPTVHKVLLHGSSIIKHFGLPIGCLSEEAQEASNKIFRKARAQHSRMISREATNEDIMHYLLISSDPFISSIRIKQEKKLRDLSPEVKDLLKN